MEKLLNKDAKFEWNDECQRSLDTMKQEMVAALILGFFRLEEGVSLHCRCFFSHIRSDFGSNKGRKKRSTNSIHKSKVVYFGKKLHNNREGGIGNGVCITKILPLPAGRTFQNVYESLSTEVPA